MVFRKIRFLFSLIISLITINLSASSMENMLDALGERESGMSRGSQQYNAVERTGLDFFGKYQFGEALLCDLGYFRSYDNDHYFNGSQTKRKNMWEGRWSGKNGVYSLDGVKGQGHIQEIIIREAFQHNKGIIERALGKKLNELSGRYTEGGILCGAHLCGPYAVINFFQNGAIARDENETTITTYMEEFSKYGY